MCQYTAHKAIGSKNSLFMILYKLNNPSHSLFLVISKIRRVFRLTSSKESRHRTESLKEIALPRKDIHNDKFCVYLI